MQLYAYVTYDNCMRVYIRSMNVHMLSVLLFSASVQYDSIFESIWSRINNTFF